MSSAIIINKFIIPFIFWVKYYNSAIKFFEYTYEYFCDSKSSVIDVTVYKTEINYSRIKVLINIENTDIEFMVFSSKSCPTALTSEREEL